MLETGTGGNGTTDPPPLGNMDSVVLLGAKTSKEVIAHAAGRIEIGMPGGGYILSTACSVAPAFEEIGRYA